MFLILCVLGILCYLNSSMALESTGPASFETAIIAAGWGKFNLILYALSITSGWCSIFETSTMSYVFPAAECDLNLKLEDKGVLNSVTYIGMIASGFLWGYLCDTLGRKKLLVFGFLLDAVAVLMAASSQNFPTLVVAKFFGGFIINGPFIALTTYLAELHCAAHRAKVQMALGVVFSIATIVLPVLAINILTLEFTTVVTEYFIIHPWNVYLYISALVPLISGIAFIFLPESPKFLMTVGRNEEAMDVFRKIYCLNTGEPEENYSVKSLVDEIDKNKHKTEGKISANRTKIEALKEGISQLKPLFKSPYLTQIILICIIQSLCMMSLNALRLWLPQLFQVVNDYEQSHNETASLCEMMDVFRPKNNSLVVNNDAHTNCTVNTQNYSVYTNSMIVAAVWIPAYTTAGFTINKLGKKPLYIFLGIVAGATAVVLYFSRNTATTISMSALNTAFGSIMINVLLAIIVDLFPTTLRGLSVSLAMMVGRVGAASGNLVFPWLLMAGCAPPFFFVGLIMLTCAVLASLLPNTENKAME